MIIMSVFNRKSDLLPLLPLLLLLLLLLLEALKLPPRNLGGLGDLAGGLGLDLNLGLRG
jgi:hypothetical protein